jgi:hypothetical protein
MLNEIAASLALPEKRRMSAFRCRPNRLSPFSPDARDALAVTRNT